MISLLSPLFFAVTVVAAVTSAISMPGGGASEEELYPAPPGYLLPWAGGEIHSVTQGEETSFTHNGLAAYAYDFDLNYDTVVASRPGKIVATRDDSNLGGCSAIYSTWTNYVVIDHGDGTAALYYHLAYGSVIVEPGEIVDRGEPIAVSGETGVTCSDIDGGPGPHLHFQVQRFDGEHYFTQSLPIAFDDIPDNDGVPQTGRSYVSGNYGPGEPQKIKLTPRRVPRVFNPTARPANPDLVEDEPALIPRGADSSDAPPAPPPPESGTPTPTPWVLPDPDSYPTETPQPTRTPSVTPTNTHTPAATHTHTPPPATPTPTHTQTPVPTDTLVPGGGGSPPTGDSPPPG